MASKIPIWSDWSCCLGSCTRNTPWSESCPLLLREYGSHLQNCLSLHQMSPQCPSLKMRPHGHRGGYGGDGEWYRENIPIRSSLYYHLNSHNLGGDQWKLYCETNNLSESQVCHKIRPCSERKICKVSRRMCKVTFKSKKDPREIWKECQYGESQKLQYSDDWNSFLCALFCERSGKMLLFSQHRAKEALE